MFFGRIHLRQKEGITRRIYKSKHRAGYSIFSISRDCDSCRSPDAAPRRREQYMYILGPSVAAAVRRPCAAVAAVHCCGRRANEGPSVATAVHCRGGALLRLSPAAAVHCCALPRLLLALVGTAWICTATYAACPANDGDSPRSAVPSCTLHAPSPPPHVTRCRGSPSISGPAESFAAVAEPCEIGSGVA